MGCLGFIIFLGLGLMGLGILIYLRAKGEPHEEEGRMLVTCIVSIAIAILIPLTKKILSRFFG